MSRVYALFLHRAAAEKHRGFDPQRIYGGLRIELYCGLRLVLTTKETAEHAEININSAARGNNGRRGTPYLKFRAFPYFRALRALCFLLASLRPMRPYPSSAP